MPSAIRKKEEPPAGAPEWMVTFGDMMSLLLCFFVMLLAMSEIKKDETYQKVVDSVTKAFGYDTSMGTVPTVDSSKNSVIDPLTAIDILDEPEEYGEDSKQSTDGTKLETRDIQPGMLVTLGNYVPFERLSAELSPEADRVIDKLAEALTGHYNKVEVRGHTTREPLPDDCPYKNHDELAFRRAENVKQGLIERGVDEALLRVVSCGPHEPKNAKAYTEAERGPNRRVDVVYSEALAETYEGKIKKVFDKVVEDG